jgi:hypothetical protein
MHATPAATPRELIPATTSWKVIFIWLLSLLHPPHIQNLHSKKSKAFKLIYLADPKRSINTTTVSGRLAEASAKNSEPKGFEDIVPTSLHTYANVFSETAFNSLLEQHKWDHAIELERKPSPGFHKVYPMTLTEQMEMDVFLEEALATRRIRQSKSPLGALVSFIKKKDGKLRFVQDY